MQLAGASTVIIIYSKAPAHRRRAASRAPYLIQEKQILFSFMELKLLQSGVPLLGLAQSIDYVTLQRGSFLMSRFSSHCQWNHLWWRTFQIWQKWPCACGWTLELTGTAMETKECVLPPMMWMNPISWLQTAFLLVLMAILIWSLGSAMEGKRGKYKKSHCVLDKINNLNTYRSRDKPWQVGTPGPTQTLSHLTWPALT